MATAMPYADLLAWFEQNDTTETGMVSRALVESLLNTLLGAGFTTGHSDWLDALTDPASNKVKYIEFMQKVLGEFSTEGVRWKDNAWLGGADPSRFPQCDIPQGIGKAEPALGADSDFKSLVQAAPGLEPQSVNRIKKCPSCGKPCAITMPVCNACGADLKEVAESTTSNLFVGMVYGVAKAPFPLKISMRTETPAMMVFDDPLALTRAHVLAVPTDVHVPDIRSLFTDPAKGLALIQKMETAAWEALVAGPLADNEWRQKALSSKGAAEDVQALRKHVIKAFNLPPSQYQLHLQYMLPPLMPQHFVLWKKGVHYCKLRHFPYDYVVKALEAMLSKDAVIADASSMTADELVKKVAEYGVDYDKCYEADQEQLGKSNLYLANWAEDDFSCVVAGDTVTDKAGQALADAKTPKDVEGADKLALQGYGRPYEGGKPGGVYYSHTPAPAALPELG